MFHGIAKLDLLQRIVAEVKLNPTIRPPRRQLERKDGRSFLTDERAVVGPGRREVQRAQAGDLGVK